MVTNYKMCSAMKKFITSMLIAAAALTACSKGEDIIINNSSDKVSFSATVEAPQSRSVLEEDAGKYHAEWVAGDYLELFEITITGGTKAKAKNVNTTLTEGGKTAKVSFELSAKTADSYAYILSHNNASINGAATYLAFTLPNNQAPTAMNTYDPTADLIISKGVELATQPTATVNFEMARVTALAKVTVKNLELAAGDAVKSVNFVCPKNISGKMTNILTDDIIAGNYALAGMKDSSPVYNNVTVTLPEAQSADFSYYMSVWPTTIDAGEKVTVTAVTEKGGIFSKEITLPKVMELVSGDILAFTVNMAGIKDANATPEQPVEQPKYVTVAGIKWATGNLQYEKDAEAGEGFAAGWRIAKNQASYQNDSTTARTDYNQSDLFNFGGIEDPFSPLATASVVAEIGTDISGKLYTDQACTTATTDFAAAKYGDIAYWASNGQYRMPTEAEIATLLASASAIKATYTLAGKTITGVYFFNPAEGTTPTIDTATAQAITDEDLAVGIFLPFAGRGYNAEATQYGIYNTGSQGIYRASVVNTGDGANQPCYGVVFAASNVGTSKVALPYWNKAFDAKGRYAIRPIYIE